jgi:transglutaminase-like putative cysteine protease
MTPDSINADITTALIATEMVNSSHDSVQALAQEIVRGVEGTRERAVAIYYAVRDGFRYDPYEIDLSPQGISASSVIANGKGWCVPKAALLAALGRSQGIPARLGFSDVKNHLSTPRLRALMDTDIFYWHGYTSLWIDGRWVKATPAFNRELCEKMGIQALEFDGTHDSISHPFDLKGNLYMEYITDHGLYDDVPLQKIIPLYQRYYARLLAYKAGGWQEDVNSVQAGRKSGAGISDTP